MSSSAFDGTPARREDVSMRLRVQRMKNVAEQTKLLEEESRKMEERLQELKLAMGREKEEREMQGGGFWKTGQQGALANHAQKVLNSSADLTKTKDGKPRKIKVIKDEPNVAPASSAGSKGNRAPAMPGTMAFLLQKENANASPGGHQRGTASGRGGSRSAATTGSKSSPLCGQCEQQAAVVSCFECSEQYCAHCFASFHLRGALKKHRSAPLIANTAAPPPPAHQPGESRRGQSSAALVVAEQQPLPSERSSVGADESGRGSATKRWAVPAQHRPAQGDKSGTSAAKTAATLLASHANWKSEGSLAIVRKERDPIISTSSDVQAQEADANASLLDGAFNEEDSALSFQEALKQWRMSSAAKNDSSTTTKIPLQAAVSKPRLDKSHEIIASAGIDEGTSTASLKRVPYEPEFQSSGGLKYADRLLLKAHRRTELGPLTERSNSVRDATSSSTRLPSVANGHIDSEDESSDGADIEEPPLDFAQLRDLATPRVQESSAESVTRPIVEEVVDIVEADNLSDDGPVEAVHYTVIEDGEVIEELVQSSAPNSKKAAGKSVSKIKQDAPPALRASSDRQDKRSALPSTGHGNKIQATQPSHATLEQHASAKQRKPGVSRVALGAAAATEKTATEKAATEKAATEKAATEKPATEKAATEKAATEKAATEKAALEKATTGKAAAFATVRASSDGLSKNSEQSNTGKASATDAGAISADQLLSARTDRRTQSRPGSRARPPTRARSRAEKAAELRKGGLSLEASNELKEVSRRLSETSAAAALAEVSHVDALGDFFRLWIPAEQVERTLTPTSHKKAKDADKDGGAAGLQKHHVSNKIYLTSPQVWRPHSSTAEAVAEEEAIRYVNSLPNYDLKLAVTLDDGEETVDLVESNLHVPASMKTSFKNDASNAADSLHSVPPVALKHDAEGSIQLLTNNGSSSARPDSVGSRVLHLRPQRAITPRRSVDNHNAPRRAGSQLSASQQRRDGDASYDFTERAEADARTTAENKDTMASYDLVLDVTRSSEGSDELRTLDELERELASQTGRLTAEGIKSCLPDSLDAEESSPTRRSEGEGVEENRVDNGDAVRVDDNNAQRSWDLRESMMHDFEDLEQAFADELDE